MILNEDKKPMPTSCDTFVAVGLPLHLNKQSNQTVTVFGKNSDRPNDETHEVVFFPTQTNKDTTVKCQYITIPQVPTTYSVILSRPAWLWGCEMGANEHGLCAGNEAVWTREEDKCDNGVERLLGNFDNLHHFLISSITEMTSNTYNIYNGFLKEWILCASY